MMVFLWTMAFVFILGILSIGTLWGAHAYFRVQDRAKNDIVKALVFLGFISLCIALPLWLLSILFSVYQDHIGSLTRTVSFLGWLMPTLVFALVQSSCKKGPKGTP